jgi:D-3-phosphoglycerate dehydrogenase
MKVLVPEKIDAEALNVLREQGHEVLEVEGRSAEELCELMPGVDALIVRSATKVDEQLLESADELKIVGRAGTGVDNIDITACTARGILVCNTPDANTNAAAELAVGLAFSAFRNIGEANMRARRGDFRRGEMVGNELEGKVAGLIGFGRIAQGVARKLQGLGMKVMAYDPFVTRQRIEHFNVIYCEKLEELLPVADLISIHTPKTKETTNMLSAPQFKLCKKGVRVVNAARGGLINEKDLYDALVSGQVASAAMDVLTPEPKFTKKPEEQDFHCPLLDLDNFTYTPHLGASTTEAAARVGFGITDIVSRALEGEMVPAINMPPVSGSADEMKPYISLCERLGSIYFQAETTTVTKIEITYCGTLMTEEVGLLTLSVLKGFLTPISENRISFVNVRQNVEEMGIKVAERKACDSGERYENMITVTYTQDTGKTLSVSGAIMGSGIQVLVDFFGYKVNIPFSKYMLALQNDDIPGVIGRVGTVLGNFNINISNLIWAVKHVRHHAQAFVCVDNPVNDEVIAELKKQRGVLRVSRLRF